MVAMAVGAVISFCVEIKITGRLYISNMRDMFMPEQEKMAD
jgi:hypothetical protein